MVQEGVVIRGKAALNLAASVRQVSRAACQGAQPRAFWHALGFTTAHELMRKGHAFTLLLGEHTIQVDALACLVRAQCFSLVYCGMLRLGIPLL